MLKEDSLISFLQKFDQHPFLVKINGKEHLIGEGEPTFTAVIKKMIPVKELMRSTSIALGEAYMDGDIEIEGDLYEAMDYFLGQMDKFSTDESALHRIVFSSTSKANQEKEVQSHYDIGDDFYRLWLDKTMSYSCGYFKSDTDTLYDAQVNKVHYILEKLHLHEGMTLLDIGCGWGFLLIEAASKYGVKGTGITLSEEQYKTFSERIEKLNLSHLLDVKLMDYRELPKTGAVYDRIVSTGMLEHVGRDQYKTYMQCASQVLADGGLFLLHFISALKEHPGDAWMKKYIFPGGTIPSLREVIYEASEENFHLMDAENLRLHYNRTLLQWRENFNNHRDIVREKYGERFTRMWDLYLAACAATFHNGIIDVHQLLLTKGINNELPMVRWY